MQLVEDLAPLRKLIAEKEPVRVRVQFMPALVEAIERREERGRVRDVDHDRPTVTSARFPDAVELRIIDRHELSRFVAVTQAQPLVDLEAPGAGTKTLFEALHFPIGPVVVIDAVEIDQRKRQKPAGMRLIERCQRLPQSSVPPAVEVDHRPDAGFVHFGQILPDPFGREVFAAAQMIVNVDHRETGRIDDGRPGDEHRARLPVAEFELANVIVGGNDSGASHKHRADSGCA